jgi:hypothetical protein
MIHDILIAVGGFVGGVIALAVVGPLVAALFGGWVMWRGSK